jgi:hypothetical protein
MTTFLIAALSVTTLLCLMFGRVCYMLVTAREQSWQYEKEQRRQWMDEREQMRRYLSEVTHVLNANVGGISKRITESVEIADAIYRQSPDLFKSCDGLAYWLHANDQFLNALYNAAAEGIDPDHRRRVHEIRKDGRRGILSRIYESAGLPSAAHTMPQ